MLQQETHGKRSRRLSVVLRLSSGITRILPNDKHWTASGGSLCFGPVAGTAEMFSNGDSAEDLDFPRLVLFSSPKNALIPSTLAWEERQPVDPELPLPEGAGGGTHPADRPVKTGALLERCQPPSTCQEACQPQLDPSSLVTS